MNKSAHSPASQGRLFVYVALVLVLGFNFLIRWHLRDMPLERDEGEYAYAGQLILQGIPPYKLVYNMKFPGVYFMYALLMGLFGQSASGIHCGIILITSLTALLLFCIGRQLLSEKAALLAAAIYVCLAALPKAAGLAGHITHFVSFFACIGVLAALTGQKRNPHLWWFFSGLGFGLAILMSQQAVFFPAFILFWFLWKSFRQRTLQTSGFVVVLFCAGCIIPFALTAIGFACAGLWKTFIYWTFQYAWHYVSMFPIAAAPEQFAVGFDPVFESGMLVWFAGIAGLICVWKNREWKGPAELAALMFLAGMAGACPGFYFRNHYFIMAMPGVALLNAAFVVTFTKVLKSHSDAPLPLPSEDKQSEPPVASSGRSRRQAKWLPLCLAILVLGNLLVNNWKMWFQTTPINLSRKLYGNSPFPEAVSIADYLRKSSSRADTIAVLGSEPEIFFLSHRHSASGYVYLYPLTEPQPLAEQMGRQFVSEIESARPKYVIFVNVASSWYSLVLPISFQHASAIQNWWAGYSTNYDIIGAAKISVNEPPHVVWDTQMLKDPATINDDILIYARKR